MGKKQPSKMNVPKSVQIKDMEKMSTPMLMFLYTETVQAFWNKVRGTRVEEFRFLLVRNRRFLMVFLGQKRSKPLRGNRRFFSLFRRYFYVRNYRFFIVIFFVRNDRFFCRFRRFFVVFVVFSSLFRRFFVVFFFMSYVKIVAFSSFFVVSYMWNII